MLRPRGRREDGMSANREQLPVGAGEGGARKPFSPLRCFVHAPCMGPKVVSHSTIKAAGAQGPSSERIHDIMPPTPGLPPEESGNGAGDSVAGTACILIPESPFPRGIIQDPNFKLLKNC